MIKCPWLYVSLCAWWRCPSHSHVPSAGVLAKKIFFAAAATASADQGGHFQNWTKPTYTLERLSNFHRLNYATPIYIIWYTNLQIATLEGIPKGQTFYKYVIWCTWRQTDDGLPEHHLMLRSYQGWRGKVLPGSRSEPLWFYPNQMYLIDVATKIGSKPA